MSGISLCVIFVALSFLPLPQDYVVNITEEFLEFISDGALAIEVWGHRCAGNGSSIWEVDSLHAKTRTLHDRFVLSCELQTQGQETSSTWTVVKKMDSLSLFPHLWNENGQRNYWAKKKFNGERKILSTNKTEKLHTNMEKKQLRFLLHTIHKTTSP